MTKMTSNGDSTQFGRMFVLPVTSPHRNEVPALGFYHLNDLTYFHCIDAL